jgi:peroxiredoxin
MGCDDEGGHMTATATVGDSAPNLTLPSLEGTEVNLADFQGKRLLLFFWGSW